MSLKKTYQEFPVLVKLAIGIGAALATYKLGKKLFSNPTGKVTSIYLTGGAGIPQTGTDTQGNPQFWNPFDLVAELHSSMEGIDLTATKEEAWKKLVELPSDDMVKAVYESFNQLYGKEYSDYPTLTKWVESEYAFLWGSNKPGALKRLRDLGLMEA